MTISAGASFPARSPSDSSSAKCEVVDSSKGNSPQLERLLRELRQVIIGPLVDIAGRFSAFLAESLSHSGLIIFTTECVGRPRKVSGEPSMVEHVTVAELAKLKARVEPPSHFLVGTASLGGAFRHVIAILDAPSDILLVVIRRPTDHEPPPVADLAGSFGVVATSIQQQVTQASPAFLAESRAASSERARTIARMADLHGNTLASILSTLRSNELNDRRARTTACDTASRALIELRATEDLDRDLAEEAVSTAFARLQGELTALLRHVATTIEYVEPPIDGRPVPGEVATAARAVVRTVVLAFTARPDVDRIRVAWDFDGSNLVLELRDDSRSPIDAEGLTRQITGRVNILRGQCVVDSVVGWGSRVSVRIPLDPPILPLDEHMISTLKNREIEVLGYLAAGKRNRETAAELGLSESTIKFHVANILRKLEVSSRGEAGALGREAGIPTPGLKTARRPAQ